MINVTAVAAACAIAFSVPTMLHAQRGRGASGEKPKVNVVQSVGCVERKNGTDTGTDTWFLTRAADPATASPGIFNVKQVEAAKSTALGTQLFQLVGVADFLDPESLLKSGRRKEFTTPETANATGELRPGRKVLVKGMLIETADPKRINLLNVVGLSDACG